jgi:hypothetical protein
VEEINMPELKQVTIEEKKFFYSLSFDIDDFIGDGTWWLQIYDSDCKLIYDKLFASSMDKLDIRSIRKIIKQKFLTYRGALL